MCKLCQKKGKKEEEEKEEEEEKRAPCERLEFV
jgi:hypothetical protein